jgi:RNA polymerase sigma factor (sigma-70 family)
MRQTPAAHRDERITVLYEQQATKLLRLVSSRVRTSAVVIEDACQTAWMRLCTHTEVDPDGPGAVRWLAITAIREAWKHSATREIPTGGWTGHDEDVDGQLPEPTGDTPDPLDIVISHEHTRELKGRLAMLADRERQFLALQALGLTYQEIAATGASIRTVERQILRGRRKLNQSAGAPEPLHNHTDPPRGGDARDLSGTVEESVSSTAREHILCRLCLQNRQLN